MRLSAEQVDHIRRYVEERGITIPTLQDDVVDHLSCEVEVLMANGVAFDDAFRDVLPEFAPGGLEEIQKETISLFNENYVLTMKKFMYLLGLFSSIAIAVGWLFSVLHWPGAQELFNYGFLGFLLFFVPVFAFERFKVSQRGAFADRAKIILGAVSAVVVGFSLVFKLFHLQGADTLLVTGMVLFAFGFLPFLFFTTYRKAISSLKGQKN